MILMLELLLLLDFSVYLTIFSQAIPLSKVLSKRCTSRCHDLEVPARQALHLQVNIANGRRPDISWQHLLGRRRKLWTTDPSGCHLVLTGIRQSPWPCYSDATVFNLMTFIIIIIIIIILSVA